MIVNWDDLTEKQKDELNKAEKNIRKILIDLEGKTDLHISSIQVDTRTF